MSWGGGLWPGGYTMRSTGVSRNGVKESAYWLTSEDLQRRRFCLTLNLSERPRTDNPSHLSEIIEPDADRKYRLSAAACQGILRRAEKRGNGLPPFLELALRLQSASRNEPESLGGKGILIQGERTGALSTVNNQNVLTYSIQGNTIDRDAHQNGLGVSEDIAHTLNAVDRHAVRFPETVNTLPARMDGSPCIDRGPPFIVVYDARGGGDGKIVPTMVGDHFGKIGDYTALCVVGQLNQMSMEPVSNTLDTMHDQEAVMIAYSPEVAHALKAKANLKFREDSEPYIVTAGFKAGQSADGGLGYEEGKAPTLSATPSALEPTVFVAAVNCRNGTVNGEVNGTLQAKEQGQNLNSNNVILIWPEVRRLTPLECTRLQGYPDGWVDIGEWTDSKGKTRKDADAQKFKSLGNSIALPFWAWLLRRISAQYERPATLGSLFDGIGGFPLCWERCNGHGTAIWASEIDDFCMAVTKKHFQ